MFSTQLNFVASIGPTQGRLVHLETKSELVPIVAHQRIKLNIWRHAWVLWYINDDCGVFVTPEKSTVQLNQLYNKIHQNFR